MKIGGCFFGYGGLDLAVQAVWPDAELAWYSEVDKGANKIAAHRFPDVPNHGDITKIDWSAVEPIDILTGGSPCQDLSHAGRRKGMTEGTRSNLWVAMREAIAQLRPRLVIWENVRGAYSAEADSDLGSDPRLLADTRRRDGQPVLRALGRVLGDLSDLGYVGGWHGLRAADVGAPHGRFRVFVVAHADSEGRGCFRWLEPVRRDADGRRGANGHGQAAQPATLLPTPATSDTNGPGGHGDGGLDLRTAVSLMPTPRATDGTKGGPNQRGSSGDLMLPSAVTLMGTPRASEWKGSGPVGSASHEHWLEHEYLTAQVLQLEADRLLPTPRVGADRTGRSAAVRRDSMSGPSLGQAVEIAAGELPREFESWEELPASWQNSTGGARWGDYAAAIARWEHVLGRPAPAPTMTSARGNPQLSPAFVEWLMGLPAGWVTDVPGITRNEALKALGNGVVPQQAEAAVRFLLSVIEVAA